MHEVRGSSVSVALRCSRWFWGGQHRLKTLALAAEIYWDRTLRIKDRGVRASVRSREPRVQVRIHQSRNGAPISVVKDLLTASGTRGEWLRLLLLPQAGSELTGLVPCYPPRWTWPQPGSMFSFCSACERGAHVR